MAESSPRHCFLMGFYKMAMPPFLHSLQKGRHCYQYCVYIIYGLCKKCEGNDQSAKGIIAPWRSFCNLWG